MPKSTARERFVHPGESLAVCREDHVTLFAVHLVLPYPSFFPLPCPWKRRRIRILDKASIFIYLLSDGRLSHNVPQNSNIVTTDHPGRCDHTLVTYTIEMLRLFFKFCCLSFVLENPVPFQPICVYVTLRSSFEKSCLITFPTKLNKPSSR